MTSNKALQKILAHTLSLRFFAFLRTYSLLFTICLLVHVPFEVQSEDIASESTLEESWAAAKLAISQKDFSAAQGAFDTLDSARFLYGVAELEEIALVILSEANRFFQAGDKEHALYLLRQADRFAETSPRLRLESLGLRSRLRGVRFVDEFRAIVLGTLRSPLALIGFVASISYPILWSLSFGFFISLAIFFIFHRAELLESFLARLHIHHRAVGGLVLLLVVLLAPLLAGPLWSIAVWACLGWHCLPKIPRICFGLLSALFACWALVIPLAESLHGWLRAPAFQSMMQVAQGGARGADRAFLEGLSTQYPLDPALRYTLAQMERRENRLVEARSSFEHVQSILSESPEVLAQLAVLSFLEGKLPEALDQFKNAEKKGIASAAFFFNFSRAQFAVLQTEKSELLLRKAYQLDRERTKGFEAREKVLGSKNPRSVAEMPLPWHVYLQSALQFQSPEVTLGTTKKFHALGFGLSQALLLFCGVIFCILSFRTQRDTPRLFYGEQLSREKKKGFDALLYFAIPLAAPLSLNRLLLPIIGYSVLFFCLSPFFAWPLGSDRLIEYLGPFTLLYGLCVLFLAILFWFLGHRTVSDTGPSPTSRMKRRR